MIRIFLPKSVENVQARRRARILSGGLRANQSLVRKKHVALQEPLSRDKGDHDLRWCSGCHICLGGVLITAGIVANQWLGAGTCLFCDLLNHKKSPRAGRSHKASRRELTMGAKAHTEGVK